MLERRSADHGQDADPQADGTRHGRARRPE
jgi:hypothetical protein